MDKIANKNTIKASQIIAPVNRDINIPNAISPIVAVPDQQFQRIGEQRRVNNPDKFDIQKL